MKNQVRNPLTELSELAATMGQTHWEEIVNAAQLIARSIGEGGKVLVCGNGGSAADAQHFAAELVGRYVKYRRPLSALSLAVDPSTVTAIGNDFGFEEIFARQVSAHGRPGDVLVAISTSGTSANILRAVERAKALGLVTVALVAASHDPDLDSCDGCVTVPSSNTQRIQEIHSAVLHAICDQIESTIEARGDK